jgi:glycosyltransferase involved in cell wall biosynthesis
MVRDEEDVIETVLRHMATQVDEIIVADNRSVDGTAKIIDRLMSDGLPIMYQFDPEVGYMQSEKTTRLAHVAGQELGATWIVPFDADEIWYSSWGRLGDFLRSMKGVDIVQANLFDHVCTALDDPDEPDPVKRIGWRRDYCAPLPKVACRYDPNLIIGMGNHEAWNDRRGLRTAQHKVAIRHFPYRSVDQIIRKIRNGAEAYAATDLPADYGAHWRQWGVILERDGEEAIAELFRKWYWREHPGVKISIDGEISMPLKFDPALDAASIW